MPTTTNSLPAREHLADHYNFCNNRIVATLPASGFSAAAIFQYRQ